MHEFTNLNPALWNGTLPDDRAPHVAAYWERCDPSFREGGVAESFTDLLDRARDTLSRLESLNADSPIYIFSHGYFINAIRSLVTVHALSDHERMKVFVPAFVANPIRNTQRIELAYNDNEWKISNQAVPMVSALSGLD